MRPRSPVDFRAGLRPVLGTVVCHGRPDLACGGCCARVARFRQRMSGSAASRPPFFNPGAVALCVAVLLSCNGCVAFQASSGANMAPASPNRVGLASLRRGGSHWRVSNRRPVTALRMAAAEEGGGAGEKGSPKSFVGMIKQLPILRTVFNFARWAMLSLQSLLVMRLAWLARATSTLQRSLLDPKQRLVSPPARLTSINSRTPARPRGSA